MRIKSKTMMDRMNAEKPDDVLADLETKHSCAPVTSSAEADNVGCPPDCGHTVEEHKAFDEGSIEGRTKGFDAVNPHESGPDELYEAWETGRSAGMCDAAPLLPNIVLGQTDQAKDK
jgi:hypothetical protein